MKIVVGRCTHILVVKRSLENGFATNSSLDTNREQKTEGRLSIFTELRLEEVDVNGYRSKLFSSYELLHTQILHRNKIRPVFLSKSGADRGEDALDHKELLLSLF